MSKWNITQRSWHLTGGGCRAFKECAELYRLLSAYTPKVQTLYRRRSRHFPCFTSLQSTDSEIHSSPPLFILLPLACSSLPNGVGAQLTCRTHQLIHPFLSLSRFPCSCTSKMFIMTRYDVQNSSPLSPAMIITHFCSTEPSFTRTFELISPTNHLH